MSVDASPTARALLALELVLQRSLELLSRL
jgi:hypothetical protein